MHTPWHSTTFSCRWIIVESNFAGIAWCGVGTRCTVFQATNTLILQHKVIGNTFGANRIRKTLGTIWWTFGTAPSQIQVISIGAFARRSVPCLSPTARWMLAPAGTRVIDIGWLANITICCIICRAEQTVGSPTTHTGPIYFNLKCPTYARIGRAYRCSILRLSHALSVSHLIQHVARLAHIAFFGVVVCAQDAVTDPTRHAGPIHIYLVCRAWTLFLGTHQLSYFRFHACLFCQLIEHVSFFADIALAYTVNGTKLAIRDCTW